MPGGLAVGADLLEAEGVDQEADDGLTAEVEELARGLDLLGEADVGDLVPLLAELDAGGGLAGAGDADEDDVGLVEGLEHSIRERVHEQIERAVAAGELDAETEDVHVFLAVFFHGLLFLQTNCPHLVGPTNERLDAIWRILFRGLSGREPRPEVAS